MLFVYPENTLDVVKIKDMQYGALKKESIPQAMACHHSLTSSCLKSLLFANSYVKFHIQKNEDEYSLYIPKNTLDVTEIVDMQICQP